MRGTGRRGLDAKGQDPGFVFMNVVMGLYHILLLLSLHCVMVSPDTLHCCGDHGMAVHCPV